MSFTLSFIEKPGYLHAIITGENSRETVEQYLKAVLNGCLERQCRRLLIEERLEGPRLGTLDLFQLASQGSQSALGHFDAIAYVDIYSEDNRMIFPEIVAQNRAIPVKLFKTVKDAVKWLNNKATE